MTSRFRNREQREHGQYRGGHEDEHAATAIPCCRAVEPGNRDERGGERAEEQHAEISPGIPRIFGGRYFKPGTSEKYHYGRIPRAPTQTDPP